VLAGRNLFRGPSRPEERSPVATAPEPLLDPPHSRKLVLETTEEPAPPRPAARPLEDESDYTAFLTSLDLRHLSPDEIINPHRGIVNGVANSLPPRELWEQLAPTLKVADEIRERLALPLCRITSAFRAPEYNAVIPGAVRHSYHTRNVALDLVYYCAPRTAYNMAVTLRQEGFFRGGIGLYPTFIHLDTRGYAATWGRA
jgi:hypothetical protein